MNRVLESGVHIERKDGKLSGYTLVDDADIGARLAILSHFIEALDIPSVKILTVTTASRTYLRDALATYREMVAARGEANRLARAVKTELTSTAFTGSITNVPSAGVSIGPEWTPAPPTPKKRSSRRSSRSPKAAKSQKSGAK